MPAISDRMSRAAITVCVMLATIMQALDTTIANVALPYMQGTLAASQDQINWVLTSYIVAAAIMTPPTGWLARRFGRKRLFLVAVTGFTFASVLCGAAQSLPEMVAFRLLQGNVRCGPRAAIAVRAARHLSARAAGPGNGDLGHGHHGRADPRPDARRLADRELQLALGFLHQPARRHPCGDRHDLLPDRVRARPAHAPRLVRLRDTQPRHRRPAAHAGPRRAARLVRFGAKSSPKRSPWASPSICSSSTPRRRKSPSSARPCFATAISRCRLSASSSSASCCWRRSRC